MILGERFEAALVFAANRHAEQRRKGTEIPYIAHLLSVCALVLEAGGDEDEAIAALLHDAVEDQAATLEEVRVNFGERVAGVVDECSDTDEEPKPEWLVRKQEYIARLPRMTRSAQLVTAADKLHNAQAIAAELGERGETVWEKFNGGRDGTLWYYRSVADGLSLAPASLRDALGRAVTALERSAGVGAS